MMPANLGVLTMDHTDIFIDRALQLARLGETGAHPNPMVGCVITDGSGRIIGEGYHRTCGEAHAEVNAVNDAKSRGHSLVGSTVYVTLEPCAHYGKTPPCARLLVSERVGRVVVGCIDPFAKVCGQGIAMLRRAGIEVEMAPEETARRCRDLNVRFFTAHTLKRPYVAVKLAMTRQGLVDTPGRLPGEPPLAISSPAGRMAVHRFRSTFDAIAVGRRTLQMDCPRLDARLWPGGRAPRRVEFHRGPLLPQLQELYSQGVTSLLVEGGPELQSSFRAEGLVDAQRIEFSPQ